MKVAVSLCVALVLVAGCQPSGKINIGPADTRTAAVPTAPPTN